MLVKVVIMKCHNGLNKVSFIAPWYNSETSEVLTLGVCRGNLSICRTHVTTYPPLEHIDTHRSFAIDDRGGRADSEDVD